MPGKGTIYKVRSLWHQKSCISLLKAWHLTIQCCAQDVDKSLCGFVLYNSQIVHKSGTKRSISGFVKINRVWCGDLQLLRNRVTVSADKTRPGEVQSLSDSETQRPN